MFNAIRDQIDRKLLQPKDLTERHMMGNRGGRGLIDLFLLKRDLLKYLTTTWLDDLQMPSDVKAKAPEVLASHKSYAQNMSPIEGAQPIQMTWRRTWSQSSILAIALIEDLVYGDGNDPALRTATKSGKGPRDIMAFESMVAKVADIQRMRKDELDAVEKENLPANSVSQSAPGSVPPESAPVDDAIGKEALRILDSQISLIVEPQDGIELKQAIMNSCFKNTFGNETTGCAQLKKQTTSVALCDSPLRFARPSVCARCRGRYILIIYDVKQASESQSKPASRIPPLKEPRYKKCLSVGLDARRQLAGYDEVTITGGDMFLIFDGKRMGNISKLRNGFTDGSNEQPLKRFSKVLNISYAEDGLTEALALVRKGTASVKQNERVIMVAKSRPKLTARKRKHFTGTTRGDTITEVPCPPPENRWKLTVSRKRALYGSYWVPVGGKDGSSDESDVEEEEDEPKARKNMKSKITQTTQDEARNTT